MRQHLFFILLLIFPLISNGQAIFDSLPSLQEHEILLMGENHFGREIQDMELDIISHYVRSSQDTFVVFIEGQYMIMSNKDNFPFPSFKEIPFPAMLRKNGDEAMK